MSWSTASQKQRYDPKRQKCFKVPVRLQNLAVSFPKMNNLNRTARL